jgi:hypothetical protein
LQKAFVNEIAAPVTAGSEPLTLRAQDREPLQGWAAALSLVFSLLILAAVAHTMRHIDAARVLAMVPRSPLFWTVFAAFYLAQPASEWLIYRRLWRVPAGCFAALLRKLVCNELLLGYLGEAYLYGWARRKVAMTAAPFGTIKDVAILSAMAGNGITLALLVLVWPFVGVTQLGLESRPVVLSLSVVLATSIIAMVLRKRIFTLDRARLAFVLRIHLLRILLIVGLTALLWHLVLPAVPLVWWLLLATLRMLISRLPFVPNKDVVFAGLAVFMLGHEAEIAALMTMMASIILLSHAVVGAGLVLGDLLRRGANE